MQPSGLLGDLGLRPQPQFKQSRAAAEVVSVVRLWAGTAGPRSHILQNANDDLLAYPPSPLCSYTTRLPGAPTPAWFAVPGLGDEWKRI